MNLTDILIGTEFTQDISSLIHSGAGGSNGETLLYYIEDQSEGADDDYIKFVADDKNLSLLPVSDSLWLEIKSRSYQLKSDYNPKSFPLLRRVFGGIFHHYLLKQSWNDIAKAKGQWILFDQIHLNERGAEIVFKLAKKFISKI